MQTSSACPGCASLDASSVFLEPAEFGTGGQDATSVAVADVNGDSIPDLLVTNISGSGSVAVLLGNGNGTYQAAVSYSSGGSVPDSVAAGDLNGDGKIDVVVANRSGYVAVLLGNGDGTFRAAVSYPAGGAAIPPVSVAVADVNGDGKPDVVVTNPCVSGMICINGYGPGAVWVFLGNGDGTLQPGVIYSSGGQTPRSVAIADVNGDGKPDLLIANSCTQPCDTSNPKGLVGVLLGNGDGTFGPTNGYYSGGSPATSIAVGDMNGDGKPDLVVANECFNYCGGSGPGIIGVLLGNGDGTFQPTVSYPSGGVYAESLVLLDANGDGKLDVAVANNFLNIASVEEGGIGLLLGNGDGSLQAPAIYNSAGVAPSSLAVADVNRDGKPDLIVANDCDSSLNQCSVGGVAVMLGNGNGRFQAARAFDTADSDARAVADVNGDGIPDLVVAYPGNINTNPPLYGTVGVMLGNGDGTFRPVANYYGSGGIDPHTVLVADLNRDGIPDLIVENDSPGNLGVMLGNGDGTFGPLVIYAVGGWESASGATVADVNGDGIPDVLVSTPSLCVGCNEGGVSVLLGKGDGTFQPPVAYDTNGLWAESVAVADVDGDGKPDLLVTNSCASVCGTTQIVNNSNVGVLLGNGDGTFRTAVTYPAGGTLGGAAPLPLAVGDVNGDGKPDLLVLNVSSLNLGVLLGNGDGTFQAPKITLLPSQVGTGDYLAVADFNGDGKLDVAGAGGWLLLGKGDGTFQNLITLGAEGYGIAVGDFNGDGSPDLAVGAVTVLLDRLAHRAHTTTKLVSSANPSNAAETVTFMATVTSLGKTSPTGKVAFTINGNKPFSVSLTKGQAKLNWTFGTAGERNVVASYSGDKTNAPSTAPTLRQLVNPR